MTEEESIEDIENEYKALMSEKNEELKAAKIAKEAKEAEETMNAAADAKAQELFEAYKLKADKEREEELGHAETDEPDTFSPDDETRKTVDPLSAKVLRKATKWLKSRGLDIKDIKPYSSEDLNAMGANPAFDAFAFAFADADDGCGDDVSAWSPADTWCNSIWYAVQCKQQLAGRVTVRACNIGAGDGLSVQIRTISADSFPTSSLGACECASCVSNTFSTHTLTLARYDLFKVMCNLDEFDVGEVLPVAMAGAMVNAFSSGIDALIFSALSGASPVYSETSSVSFICDPSILTDGYCCSYGANLYKEVIELEADMRAAGYFQDAAPILILHPSVALYLKYKEGINPPPWVNNITMDGNKLSKIGDIEVIEYCGATACTDLGSAVMGVLIDPSRAVGEAYGKRPALKRDEDPIECDSVKFVYRTYIAIAALEVGAIGHILNP